MSNNSKRTAVAFYGKMRIPTIGHAEAVKKAKSIADETGGKLQIGLSPTSQPLTAKSKREHASRIFQHPVMPEGEHTKNVFSFLSHLNKRADHLHLVAGSDRAQEYHHILSKYNGKPDKQGNVQFNYKSWKVHPVEGERVDTDKDPTKMNRDELVKSVSASKVEHLAKTGNYKHFAAYHPDVPKRHVRSLYNEIRRAPQEDLNEEMTIGQTMSRSLMPQIKDPTEFKDFLKKQGLDYSEGEMSTHDLKTTQSEFDPEKIKGIIEKGSTKPIVVSNDNHILDGHHRAIADDVTTGKTNGIKVNASILSLLDLTRRHYPTALNEELTHDTMGPMLDSFLQFAKGYLHIKALPYVEMGKTGSTSFGGYNPSEKKIVLDIKGRHKIDSLRTLAHELVHHRQNEEGRLKDVEKDGRTGSPIEDEANAMAGRMMREFGRANPKEFHSLDEEFASLAEKSEAMRRWDNEVANQTLNTTGGTPPEQKNVDGPIQFRESAIDRRFKKMSEGIISNVNDILGLPQTDGVSDTYSISKNPSTVGGITGGYGFSEETVTRRRKIKLSEVMDTVGLSSPIGAASKYKDGDFPGN